MSTLEEIETPVCWDTPPPEILRTIKMAERLRKSFLTDPSQPRIPSLVNSNYYIAYHALKHLIDHGLAGDRSFCEWGSGLGVVTCLAAQLGFDATGIEIEASLCDCARSLAEQAGVTAEFFEGSYRGQDDPIAEEDSVKRRQPFPLGQRFSDVVYAYPWPAEEAYVESLFKPSSSAILVTYHGGATLRVRRSTL